MSDVDRAVEAGARALRDSFEDPDDAQLFADLAITAAWPVLSAKLRELHRPVEYAFSWRDGLHRYEPCQSCKGKAGTHPCGCWQDADREYECRQCSRLDGGKGVKVSYPCATARLLGDIDRGLGIGGEG